jgi:hypothetical protein
MIGVVPSDALASDDRCLEFKSMLLGQRFIAKVPLYDTKIQNEGIIDLERDKEEIPKGAELTVLKVECETKKIEVKVRQVAPKKLEAVDLRFFLSEAERYMPNAVEEFKKMMGYVFEIPQSGEAEGSSEGP